MNNEYREMLIEERLFWYEFHKRWLDHSCLGDIELARQPLKEMGGLDLRILEDTIRWAAFRTNAAMGFPMEGAKMDHANMAGWMIECVAAQTEIRD